MASGSGEHALFLAPCLAVASWQPSDPDPAARQSIDAWREENDVPGVLPAVDVDVLCTPWRTVGTGALVDVVVCINLIHIAPWSACQGLMAGAAQCLAPKGLLFLYGPYRRGGAHTAPSNAEFDASLRSRDPAWGVRDLEAVTEVAVTAGFALAEVVEMPANNLSVLFRAT